VFSYKIGSAMVGPFMVRFNSIVGKSSLVFNFIPKIICHVYDSWHNKLICFDTLQNILQQKPNLPVRESSDSPYFVVALISHYKVGTNSPCKHLIFDLIHVEPNMQVSGNESVHNLVGRLMTTEAVQMPVLPHS